MHSLQRSFLLACAASFIMGCTAMGQDQSKDKAQEAERTFTQVPEVMSMVSSIDQGTQARPKNDFEKAPSAQWIWGAESNRKYSLQQSFDVQGLKSARVRVSCDNVITLKINGKAAGKSSSWENPLQLDATTFLKNGKNEIVAEVANQGGISGCCLQLVWFDASNTPHYVVSDATWTAREQDKEADASAVRVVGKLGDKPWGNVFENDGGDGISNGAFVTLPGFQVERLFTVPKEQLGSWVAMTIDSRGRILATDQGKEGFCRITPLRLGAKSPRRSSGSRCRIAPAV